ncbi:MAG TPA: phenylalanine--tRNA ligase subunit beta [Candidatus Krumholzibacteria bacterium]|nr:phenylalanine--tRNA ligase subunit beta [Candidatus Krumholzibacteria bacterium]
MNVSLSWLRRYVDITVDAPTLAHDLTMHGIKVERLTSSGLTERLVVVGHVLEAKRHPEADRLSVCRVDVGQGEPLEIVCGAPNVASGQRVAVALVGAKLPNGVKLRKSKIRGVASNGMICSEVELGLGTESGGILVLAPDAPVGVPLADVLGETDAVLELEVTPNRPDQLSHVGVAREIAALYRTRLRPPQVETPVETPDDTEVAVEIADPADCFRFTARVIHGVVVKPSPAWLKGALERVGVHSVNNIVDVTNFVMMEMGQPMHGYDVNGLPSSRMGVRRARRGESIEALDAATYELDDSHLVITAGDDVVGVAGVIGGMASRINEATTDVLLESAAFDPKTVRRTRRALGLSTDASYRFERGSDREACRRASDRAAALIVEVAGGRVGKWVDVFPAPRQPRAVTLRRSTVRRLLGENLTSDAIAEILGRLEFALVGSDADAVTVAVPSFRWDIEQEADLVEEVARVYGYENIGKGWRYRSTVPSAPDPFDRFVDRLAEHLVARGHTEILTTSFSDGREQRWFGWADSDPRSQAVVLKNPLSSTHAQMRTHLLPGALDAVAHNVARGRRELYLFALGRVFVRSAESAALPDEPTQILIARTRPEGSAFWRAGAEPVDFFEIKAEVESLLATHAPDVYADLVYEFEPTHGTFRFSDRRRAVVEGGIVPVAAARELDLTQPVWYAVVDVSALFEHAAATPAFKPYSEYPPSRRDLSLVAPSGIVWAQIEKHVVKVGGRLLESLQVFDVYRGGGLGEGMTAYGVRLSFRSNDATLTDTDVDALIAKLVSKLESELGVVLRS